MNATGHERHLPDWRPPHAYVPGKTPRHPEGYFDACKSDAQKVPLDVLHKSAAWTYGLAFLNEGYFWEAHEVLEAVWLACPPASAERLLVQAIIQLANARLKAVMDQPRANQRLQEQADRLAGEAFQRSGGQILGLDKADWDILKMKDVNYNAQSP